MIALLGRIFGIVLGIICLNQILHDFSKRKIPSLIFVLWVSVWLAIICVGIYPPIIDIVTQKTGGKTGLGTLLGVGLTTVLFICYRLYQRLDRLEERFNIFVQKASTIKKPAEDLSKNE